MNNIEQNFIWWVGVVEDRNDPLQIGRCRVRILGYHTDNKQDMPTDELPWAYPAMPINTPSRTTPVGPVEGTWIMGFFRDGNSAQQPVMTNIINYGYVNPDNITYDYLHERDYSPDASKWDKAVTYWDSVRSDINAYYDDIVIF